MGKKLSGDAYTKEDQQLLETFAYQAAVALEKARLYDAVRRHSRELKDRVQQRTAQLRQLQAAQHQMMVGISHSLQTPLTVVKGELWNLKKQQPHQPAFRRLEASIDRISKLTYDLLHLARLETISDNLRRERVDLSQLLREVVEYVDVLDRTKRITVVSDIEPHIAVWGDRKSLEELVTNLMSNALKYMSSRSPRGPAKQRERRITIALAGRGRK